MITKIPLSARYALICLIVFNINCDTSYAWLSKSFSNTFQSFWQCEHRNKIILAAAAVLAGTMIWSNWNNNKKKPARQKTQYHLFGKNFYLVQGSITRERVEAIVNAANPALDLVNSGGVSGGIYKAAKYKDQLQKDALQEVKKQPPIKLTEGNPPLLRPGNAIITQSYYPESSSIKYIIHAVGPNINKAGYKDKPGHIVQALTNNTIDTLKQAYISALTIAQQNGIQSVAFPLISGGFYGFNNPNYNAPNNAVKPALLAIKEFAQTNEGKYPQDIRLVVNDDRYSQIQQNIATHLSDDYLPIE